MMTVRDTTTADADAIAKIYNHYITQTTVTFEETPVSAGEIARRIDNVVADGLPWLVAEEAGEVVGYAYSTPWRSRRGYRFAVEVTVYVADGRGGQGIGTRLYERLFEQLEARQIKTAIGGIALPNDASIALHEKHKMRKVAHFSQVGIKFGRWIDVGYWQRDLGPGV